jgi:uncharacterized protein YmfQ (DUF2313 family)
MSLLLGCDTTQPDWCPQTTDDVLPSVLGLLPPGPAWDGAKVQGTVQNTYWRAYSNVLAYTYSRMCAYVDEFFCLTVNESRDQWIEEFGLDASCDPYGNNLCLKVAANGGATCAYFVQMAALSGYVITCNQLDDNEPIAGCFEVGCTGLGPTPVFSKFGSNLGYGQIGVCFYGEVVQHPDPKHWENGKGLGSTCLVPGSNLGQGPDTDESCCFICGWYEMPIPVVAAAVPDFCAPLPDVITFECPRRDVPSDTSPCPSYRTMLRGMDDNGNYSEWGNAYIWEVTLDAAASAALQTTTPPTGVVGTTSQAGDFMVGNFVGLPDGTPGCGTPLCFGDTVDIGPNNIVLCFLDLLKPAHTVLHVKVTQPS